MPTRLGKLVEHPGWDAVILARAGLERLGLYAPETLVEGRKLYMRPLPVEVFIPAVGQGIVGMECRSSDRETAEMLEGINDPESFACALAERAFLVRLGANCSTPVGVYAHPGWRGTGSAGCVLRSGQGRAFCRCDSRRPESP